MPVQIAAVLDHETVRALLHDLLPLTVDLGDADHPDRWIRIDPPELLEFVRGQGIRVQTGAQLHWTVARVGVPFTISAVRLLLTPVLAGETGGRLNFLIKLEDADLKNVPAFLDRSIVTHVNARLEAKPETIGWDYGKALSLRVPLPATMAPLERFEMDASDVRIELGDSELRISLALPMRLSRRSEPTPG